MADGHGGVAFEQQGGHRLADDRRAADHHRVATGDLDPLTLEELDDARWGGRSEGLLPEPEPPDVVRREAVHVLGRAHVLEDLAFREASRQRELDQEAVHRVVGVERLDGGDHLRRARVVRERLDPAREAGTERVPLLAAHVDVRSRVLAHQQHRQARRPMPLGDHRGHLGGHLFADRGGNRLTVEDSGHSGVLPLYMQIAPKERSRNPALEKPDASIRAVKASRSGNSRTEAGR